MNRIGVDLGGTKIEAAVLGRKGDMLWSERVATPKGDYAGILQAIAGLVERAKIISGDVAGVGVATPGSENPRTCLHRNANSTCLNGMPLRKDLQRLIGLQVLTANDANCFALSEAIDGAGSGAPIVFGVILGTGCGGGIVVDRIVRNGANGIAGEWGHTALPNADGVERARDKCWCGRACCLEQFLSGSAVEMDHALVNHTTGMKLKHIAAQAQAGDAACVATINRWIERLGRALGGVINVLDPDVIVLGGGASLVSGLVDRLAPAILPHIFADSWSTPIRLATFGDSSGVRGAAWLCDTLTA
ncbi:MAG: ROK family protein [Phycisphaerales bacterium]|nr:ROK family protein [Phycisphaerales bacterium]